MQVLLTLPLTYRTQTNKRQQQTKSYDFYNHKSRDTSTMDTPQSLRVAQRCCASRLAKLPCVPGCTSPDRWKEFFKAFWSALTKLDQAATADEDVVAVGRALSELQLLLSVAVVENGFGNSFKALFEEVRL